MKAKKTETITILKLKSQTIDFHVLGTMPLIHNCVSEKAGQQIFNPPDQKTKADLQGILKHQPYQEFRDSPYTVADDQEPTLITLPSRNFKAALRSAALDIPGSTKSQIGRLTWVEREFVAIYGIPQIFCEIVRQAGMNRTPDVRTRAIMPRWAAKVSITFIKPTLNATSISNLLAAAGLINGVGDWRQQKGSGSYGRFELVEEDNKEFLDIVKTGGRKAQEAAMLRCTPYDQKTEEMLSWFDEDTKARGLAVIK